MKSKYYKVLTSVFAVITLVYSLYIFDNSYKTEITKLANSGEALNKKKEISIAYPQGYTNLSIDKVSNTKQIKMIVFITPQEVSNFYNSILSKENWTIKDQKQTETDYTVTYVKLEQQIEITAVEDSDNNQTILTIKISE